MALPELESSSFSQELRTRLAVLQNKLVHLYGGPRKQLPLPLTLQLGTTLEKFRALANGFRVTAFRLRIGRHGAA